MNIAVYTANEHRCNLLIASLLVQGLRELGILAFHNEKIPAHNIIDLECCIIINGDINIYKNEENEAWIKEAMDYAKVSVLFKDDVDIPNAYDTDKVVNQFTWQNADFEFPIAQLLTLHQDWGKFKSKRIAGDNPFRETLASNKLATFIYGGSYKERRVYAPIIRYIRNNTLLLVGDNREWDNLASLIQNEPEDSKVIRLGTIRNIETYWDLLKASHTTFIPYDEKHYGKGFTLRFFEAALCGCNVVMFDEDEGSLSISAETIHTMYTAENTLSQLKTLIYALGVI